MSSVNNNENKTNEKDINNNMLIDDTEDIEEKVVIRSSGEHHSRRSSESGSGSGSHHGHRGHHSSKHGKSKRRHSGSKRKKGAVNALFARLFIVSLVIIVVLVILLVIRKYENNLVGPEKTPENNTVTLNGEFAVLPVIFNGDVDIIDEVAKYCYELDADTTVSDTLSSYAEKDVEYDKSAPVVLTPTVYNIPEGYNHSGYRVEVSEKADFSDAVFYEFKKDQTIEIDHLKTNTKYYYKVTLLPGDLGYIGSFKTSDTPRILSIDGIGNVRDIGNWETNSGKRIKQGLLYRGIELEGTVRADYKLTEAGEQVMLDILKVKYEMDLRGEYDNPTGIDVLGAGVTHKYYDAVMYKAIFTDRGKYIVKNIFTDLANPENYPMYLHCTYGLDRTGTVCFLLEALLGVSDEDLFREYELSALFHHAINDNEYNTMLTSLESYEGNTTQEKVENYLLECGITQQQIESIRNIFLEK